MTSVSTVQLVFDIFPAKVRHELTGSREPVRAILADGVLTVWKDARSGPEAVITAPALAYEGASASGFVVQTEAGMVVVTRSARCGCGSRLKRFDPFPGDTVMQLAV